MYKFASLKILGMKSFYMLCLIGLLTGAIACKQDTASQQEAATTQPVAVDTPKTAVQSPSDVINPAPNPTTNPAATGGHDYTFLTDKLLLYKGSFGGDKDSKEQLYKDEWIDFDPNGTFKAGKLQKQTHTGQWSYNHDTKTLFIRPDTKEYKMSEWKVQFNDQMLVWVGTETYKDNAVQLRLVRSATLPQ